MTVVQKTGRVLILTATLVIGSVVFAMLAAVGLFLIEKGRELRDVPKIFNGLAIIAVGILVNATCVFILVQMKRADGKLIPPKDQALDGSQVKSK